MEFVASIVNRLKGGHNALTNRLLKKYLQEVDAEYDDLLLYTEVRWLSRGKCLRRFFDLRKELAIFLEKSTTIKNSAELKEKLICQEFQMSLAFLTDISEILNETNIKMQGKNKNIFDIVSCLESLKKKLFILKNGLLTNTLHHFSCCLVISQEIENADFSIFAKEIEILINQLETRFTDFKIIRELTDVFANPIKCKIEEQSLELQMELCDLQTDIFLKNLETNGIEFWKKVSPTKYPKLHNVMLKTCSMFGSTYVCESAFSIMKNIKNEHRTRLTDNHLENLLRLALTEYDEINFDLISQKDQN